MSLRNQAIANSINLLLAVLARTRDEKKFRWTYTQIARLATILSKKDYYVERINWIKDLFDQDHPALEATRNLLTRTNPHHRKTIIQTFIINRLLPPRLPGYQPDHALQSPLLRLLCRQLQTGYGTFPRDHPSGLG
jgi:hypothetical protein